ncbi:Peptidyl-prolyl cis-trans isomerase PASTICCINO1-like protein [Drosera capensis]
MAVLEEDNEDQYSAAPHPPPPNKKKKNKDDALSDDDKRRKKLVPGGLLKAELRPGGGDSRPSDGDQVVYHCTVRTAEGVVVHSTKKELGGKGTPGRHVIGKSKMLLGLLEGIPTMLKGEIAMFKMKPGMHYAEEDCPVSAPDNIPKDDDLHFEIELIDFGKAKVIADDFGVIKKIINEGQGWESPRAPYEVKAWITAKTGDGKLIFSQTEGEPYFFTLGNSEVPQGLEMGIGTMSRKEKALIYVTSQYLAHSRLLPEIEGIDEVHFEVELVHFIQVRDVLGDGRLIKRRIRDGRGEFPMDCPLQDSQLLVHYKGMFLDDEKTVFFDTRVDNDGQPLEFSSGEGRVPEGFEMCVRLMLPGEIALVTCPPDYAYDKFPRPDNVPEGAYVQWEIELLGFEMPKDWTGLNFRSIMDEADKIKSTGNGLFKEGKYELAKANCFENSTTLILRMTMKGKNLLMPEKSIEACEKVLDSNPVHVKALYRRGMAHIAAGDFEEARTDFQMMIEVDSSSEPDATAALQKLKHKEQEALRKAKKQFKGLFDKKPGEIAEITKESAETEITEEIDESQSGLRNRKNQTESGKQDNSDEKKTKGEREAPPALPHRLRWFSRLRLVTVALLLLFSFILFLYYDVLMPADEPDTMVLTSLYT